MGEKAEDGGLYLFYALVLKEEKCLRSGSGCSEAGQHSAPSSSAVERAELRDVPGVGCVTSAGFCHRRVTKQQPIPSRAP